jgi:hypothetical protein
VSATNYFKVGSHLFFFVDSVPESVEDAYVAATMTGDASVFHPARIAGPWDSCPVIGHRPIEEIRRDLANGSSLPGEEFDLLEDELQALYDTFLDAGRTPPPAFAAAA